METLLTRLRAIIESQTEPHRRFKEMEERTGLKATAWQNFWNGRQRPTWEMIELVSMNWPEFAFWLTTGISDPQHGHQGITTHGAEYLPKEKRKATEYFYQKIETKLFGNTFDIAVKSARLVQETSGEMAGHNRYEFAPGDETVFTDWMRASNMERQAFIAREQEDAPLIADTLQRYAEMTTIDNPDPFKLYAPNTN